MASKVAICDMALSHLGHNKGIANLETDQTAPAVILRRFYDTSLEQTLRDFPWPFAAKFDALTCVENDPTTEWAYSYVYPSDCVMIRRIISGSRNEAKGEKIAYRVVNGTSRLIYTDELDAMVEYTKLETDTTLYPSDFCQAFSLRLAFYMAPSLTQGDPFKLGARAGQLYEYEISKARASSANEEQVDQPPDSEFIRERG